MYVEALARLGRFQDALSAVETALERHPDEGALHQSKGALLARLGRLEEARAALERAVELVPERLTLQRLYGYVLEGLGRPAEALAAYEQELRLNPKDPIALWGRIQSLFRLERYEEALPLAEEAYRLLPDDPGLAVNIAWALATCPDPEGRDPARAVEMARRATDRVPKHGGFWSILGAAHYGAGEWEQARQALQKAMELGGGGDDTLFFLAMTCWQLSDQEQARRWFDEGVARLEQRRSSLPPAALQEIERFHREAAELLGLDK